MIWLSYGVFSEILVWNPDWIGRTLRNTYFTEYILRYPYEIIYLLMLLSDFRKLNGFELLSQRGREATWYVDPVFHAYFSIQKSFKKFSCVHFAWKSYFCMGFLSLFCTEDFAPSLCREAFILHEFFVVTSHSEATRTSSTMGRSRSGGMRKQPNNMAQVNAEAAVGRNPIARLFCSKVPTRRLVSPKKTKR